MIWALFVVLGCLSVQGATNVWTGAAGDRLWRNPDNWSLRKVPMGGDVAFKAPAPCPAYWNMTNEMVIAGDVNLTDDTTLHFLAGNGRTCFSNALFVARGRTLTIAGFGGNVVFRGPIYGEGAFLRGRLGRPGSQEKAYFRAPIHFEDVEWGLDYTYGSAHFYAAGNTWKKFSTAYGVTFFDRENTASEGGVLSWLGYYRASEGVAASFNLEGFDQTIDRLVSQTDPGTKDSDHIISTIASPRLIMRGSADARTSAAVQNRVRLVWNPKGNFTQTFYDRDHQTSGAIEVGRGTMRLEGRGTFRHVPEMTLKPGAAFVCASTATNALAALNTLTLFRNARFTLASSAANPFTPGQLTVYLAAGAVLDVPASVRASLKAILPLDLGCTENVADKLQLLCDARTLDLRRTTAVRREHRPEFAGTVLKHDAPWEGDLCGYYNILTDADGKGPIYRMYYQGNGWGARGSKWRWTGLKICYAESRDGIRWIKPDLGIWEFKGSRKNNIIMSHTLNYWDNFMVMKDANPACLPDERYKAVGLFEPPGDKRQGKGLWCFTSADGIHFKTGWRVIPFGYGKASFDSLNVVFWDDVRKEYRIYMRGGHRVTDVVRHGRFERDERTGYSSVRDVRYATSRDFRNWTPPEVIDVSPVPEEPELYTNNIEPYFRNPDVFLGFPTRYSERRVWTDNYDKLCGWKRRHSQFFRKLEDGESMRVASAVTDAIFMWSADGRHFNLGQDCFMPPGPEHEVNWVYGSCYLARGMVVTPGRRGDAKELSFYGYVGRMSGRATELDRYCLRMDGFVSYHAPVTPKRIVTKPIVFTGTELLVNFATSAYGHMFVTVRDEEGREARSDELFGDSVDRVVGFKIGKLADFVGKRVVVTFDLSDGDLYSYRFAKTVSK